MSPDIQKYIDSQLLRIEAELTVKILKSPNSVIPSSDRKYVIPALDNALVSGNYKGILDGSIQRDTKTFIPNSTMYGQGA